MPSVVKTVAADTHASHGHDHSHGHAHNHHHAHSHSHPATGHAATGHAHAGRHPAAAPSPSLLRLSVLQRLAIVLPIGALLWAVALWVIASGGAS